MRDLKKIFLQIVFLLLIQVVHTGTASGKPLSNDSCICYTDAMDIKAITCIRAQAKKDSIIQSDMLMMLNLKDRLKIIGEEKTEFKGAYEDEKLVTTKLTEDLSKAHKWNKTIIIGGPLIGILVGILVVK